MDEDLEKEMKFEEPKSDVLVRQSRAKSRFLEANLLQSSGSYQVTSSQSQATSQPQPNVNLIDFDELYDATPPRKVDAQRGHESLPQSVQQSLAVVDNTNTHLLSLLDIETKHRKVARQQ